MKLFLKLGLLLGLSSALNALETAAELPGNALTADELLRVYGDTISVEDLMRIATYPAFLEAKDIDLDKLPASASLLTQPSNNLLIKRSSLSSADISGQALSAASASAPLDIPSTIRDPASFCMSNSSCPSLSNSCSGHGKCVKLSECVKCVCDASYTGVYCQSWNAVPVFSLVFFTAAFFVVAIVSVVLVMLNSM